ncbi:MAG: FAD-dependent oxidoreductase [Rhodospirillaceae bacterium]|nr:FAD-dependent oxidoreductase [Rhodospirillaceae bacterium]
MADKYRDGSGVMSSSKRRLLGGLGGLTAASVLPLWRRAEAATTYDVIVIGGGTAGMPTAMFAADRGAKVLVVDKAPVLGGTLDRSTGQMAASRTVYQKAAGIEDSPDAHYADNMRINNFTADPALTRLFVDNAGDTLNWLAANGFKVRDGHPVLGGGHEPFTTRRYQWGENGGKSIFAIMEPLFEARVKAGKIVTALSTGAVDLIQDAKGAVIGVTCEDDAGVKQDFMARNVVITAGGCASNPRMFEDLHGTRLTTQIAYPYSQGQGILLGLGAGGYVRGGEHYNPLFGTLLADDNFPSEQQGGFQSDPERRPPWEIYVNARGERFMREDETSVDRREHALARQPGHRMWVVADQEMIDKAPPFMSWKRDRFMEAFGTHPMFAKADTIEALAVKAGVDPRGLSQSVAAYNAALASGATDPKGKAHRPVPLAKGPFYAVRFTGWTVISFAGIAVDGGLRVIRPDGSPIANLYAAGEVLGAGATSGNAYTNGAMVTPSLTFGRLLGQRIIKLKNGTA